MEQLVPERRRRDDDRYVAMLGELGDAAPRANRAGLTAAQAGAAYALPPAVGESVLFHKVFFERAFGGWHEELAG